MINKALTEFCHHDFVCPTRQMSFVILKTFFHRLKKLGLLETKQEMFNEMIQYNLVKCNYEAAIYSVEGLERPPMVEITQYRKKFNL